jgi:hypothetical protein
MIKLKTIAEHILQEAEETITWGEVSKLLNSIKGKQNKAEAGAVLKTAGKWGASLIPGLSIISTVLDTYDNISNIKDVAKAVLNIGRDVSKDGLKNPKSSEFKNLTGPFWDALKLSPEVSTLLDDKVEAMFIDQVIVPQLSKPGNENQPVPNMDIELGKWLNKSGLEDKADIHFTGKSGNL